MCVINLQESHCGISRYIFRRLTSADVHDVHSVGSQQLRETLKESRLEYSRGGTEDHCCQIQYPGATIRGGGGHAKVH